MPYVRLVSFCSLDVEKKNGQKGQMSVAEYFECRFKDGEFKERIRFPNLPCLHVGNKDKNRYIPIEVSRFYFCNR